MDLSEGPATIQLLGLYDLHRSDCGTKVLDRDGGRRRFFSKFCDWSAFPREGPATRARTNQL